MSNVGRPRLLGQAGASARRGLPGIAPAPPPQAARAERDALKERILRAQQHRAQQARQSAAPPPADEDPDRPGELKDRVGGREALVGHLNREFMPLAHECIQQALEQSPELRGMLALGVEVVADEELGGVVDVAKAAPENEVQHAGLLECIRETAMSLTFPAPLVTGRETFMLTLRVQPTAPTDSRP